MKRMVKIKGTLCLALVLGMMLTACAKKQERVFVTGSVTSGQMSSSKLMKATDGTLYYAIDEVETPPVSAEDIPAYSGNGIIIMNGDEPYLYNRTHLLMWKLSGLASEEENLITGTRYMNAELMLSIEMEVVNYIEETGNHVLYRVTPIYEGDNLVAKGILMEAVSMEKDDLSICRFIYNVQPGIIIDYRTGANSLE